ncbi:MAG: hypothetical protein ACREA7_08215 [Nitrosotalea sp.]
MEKLSQNIVKTILLRDYNIACQKSAGKTLEQLPKVLGCTFSYYPKRKIRFSQI